jgi:hypothetical protein
MFLNRPINTERLRANILDFFKKQGCVYKNGKPIIKKELLNLHENQKKFDQVAFLEGWYYYVEGNLDVDKEITYLEWQQRLAHNC